MKYSYIIPALAEKLGVPDLVPENGECALMIDGKLITIVEVAGGDGILLSATVGEPPPEGADAFSSILLQANHEFAGVRDLTRNHVVMFISDLGNLDKGSVTQKMTDDRFEELYGMADKAYNQVLDSWRKGDDIDLAKEANVALPNLIKEYAKTL